MDDDPFTAIFASVLGIPGLFMVVLGFILWLSDHRDTRDYGLNPPSGKRMLKTGGLLIAGALAAFAFEGLVLD